jgi:pyruvate-formate lyase
MTRKPDPFKRGRWAAKIDVQDFIYHNYTPYTHGPEFLTGRDNTLYRITHKP